MPIKVINSGIVAEDEDPSDPAKKRNDRKSYPDDGISYRKKGNLVTNTTARNSSLMGMHNGPGAIPTIRRQREIKDRDQCGNASETSQPYKTLGSMHPVLHLKVVKYSQDKKAGKNKRRIRLPRRRGGSSTNDDDDSDDEELRRKQQLDEEENNKQVVDPLDEIRVAHARRHGAYMGSGKHIPVHSEEFNQLQGCVNAGYRRVKGVKAGHSSTQYLTPRTAIERAQWASEHALEIPGRDADDEKSENDPSSPDAKSSAVREAKRVPQRPPGKSGRKPAGSNRKQRHGEQNNHPVKKKVTLEEKLDHLEQQLMNPDGSQNCNGQDAFGRPLPSVPKPSTTRQEGRDHGNTAGMHGKGGNRGTTFPAISTNDRNKRGRKSSVVKAEADMIKSRLQLQKKGVASVKNLLLTRDEFVESRTELQDRLHAELEHLEFERPDRYDRKFRAFCNRFDAYLENITHADVKTEMKLMRDTAEVSLLVDHDSNLSRNQWYSECRRIAHEQAMTTGGSVPPPVMRFLKIMQTVVEDDWELNDELFFDLLKHGLRPDDHKSLELHRVMNLVRTEVLQMDPQRFFQWYQEQNIEIPRSLTQQ